MRRHWQGVVLQDGPLAPWRRPKRSINGGVPGFDVANGRQVFTNCLHESIQAEREAARVGLTFSPFTRSQRRAMRSKTPSARWSRVCERPSCRAAAVDRLTAIPRFATRSSPSSSRKSRSTWVASLW